MNQCDRCLNDNTVRHHKIEKDGICMLCHDFDKKAPELKDYGKLEKLFLDRINRIKGKHEYDAAVGISGGKDSCYVLYKLIHEYGLKVKAFTMNNGFLTDEAKANIDKLVKEFGVEHEYIEYDKEQLRRFYRYSMSKWLVPCMACSYIGYAAMINYASKIDAGVCIHGRSLEQMMRYYSHDTFTHLVDAGLKPVEEVDIVELYDNLLNSVSKRLGKHMRRDMEELFFKDLKPGDYREFIAYFLYHPYDEKEVISFLEKNTSWRVKQKQKSHYDCQINKAAKYIYQVAEGRPHGLPETSVLIRNGQITKNEARKIIDSQVYDKEPTKELNELCEYVGLSKRALLTKAKIYRRLPK